MALGKFLTPEAEAAENIRITFLSITTPQNLASFLGITPSVLAFRNYQMPASSKYKEFTIIKRSGGTRKILAPTDKIKSLQRRISEALYAIYEPLVYSHGFEIDRSIKTNAQIHSKQRYILNIDLREFFPSINFGRVRGMFLAKPFVFSPDVATILAQICCHNNELPQGAPSSPIISNIICLRLDRQLSAIALENRCYYSRYADDITFSTSLNAFPPKIGKLVSSKFRIHTKLKSTIETNGFNINENKVSFRTKYERQIVTGLVVNVSPNVKRKFIRQVRAMLNAWETYGLEEAEREYYEKYDKKNRNPQRERPSFRRILTGKVHFIGYIRKRERLHDPLYNKLRTQLNKLAKDDDSIPKFTDPTNSVLPLVITEGHTDWKHLHAALAYFKSKGKFTNLELDFWKYEPNVKFGDSVLKAFCKKAIYQAKNRKYICIFDRDSPNVVKEMDGNGSSFKDWGNSVYSFCIPVPSHRKGYLNISIEMYYSDDEVNRIDSETGKRLFFTNQIRESTEINLTTNKRVTQIEVLSNPIYEDEFNKKPFSDKADLIRDANGRLIAHSKTVFATRVYKSHKDFSNFNFVEFEKIFKIIQEIVDAPVIALSPIAGATLPKRD